MLFKNIKYHAMIVTMILSIFLIVVIDAKASEKSETIAPKNHNSIQQPIEEKTKIPDKTNHTEKKQTNTDHRNNENQFINFYENLHDWTEWMAISVCILTAAILVAGLVNGFVMIQIMRMTANIYDKADIKIKEIDSKMAQNTEKLETKIDDFDKIINNKVEWRIRESLNKKYDQFLIETKDKIEDFLENDFSEQLETRYLLAEYVEHNMHNYTAKKIYDSFKDNDIDTALYFCINLSKGKVAIRQLLSHDPLDIYTGLCTFRALIGTKFLAKNHLISLIKTMQKQKRFNLDNDDMARRLLKDLKTSNVQSI